MQHEPAFVGVPHAGRDGFPIVIDWATSTMDGPRAGDEREANNSRRLRRGCPRQPNDRSEQGVALLPFGAHKG